MKRILGVVTLLVTMYFLLHISDQKRGLGWSNQQDVLGQQAFYGILTLGVGVLIISGGIDLSIGSVVGASAIGFGVLMRDEHIPPIPALLIVLFGGVVVGLINGLLVTRLRLQPFLVTLCGLFVYRGVARMIGKGKTVGISDVLDFEPGYAKSMEFLRETLIGKDLTGKLDFPMQLVVLLVLAALIGIVLHATIYGRYCYAIGHNEQAARYAGINTDRQRLWVYVLCSTLAALGGVLTFLDYNNATPETVGVTWELYAITGAVLGGCSLRGGEGNVVGMVLGAAVLPLLMNLITFVGATPFMLRVIPNLDAAIPIIIGLTLLGGTIVDEFLRRRSRVEK